MKNIAILSSHNGSGFDTLYNAQINNHLDINIKIVISNNTNAPVLKKAQARNIQNHIVNNALFSDVDSHIYELLTKEKCEYIFLSGYMKKLSSKITRNFKVINSHPSLLPLHGGKGLYGRYVHESVIASGDAKSGVSIHEVNENYDEGKIILQKELLLHADETVFSLENRIKELEAKAIVEGFLKCLK